MMKLKNIILNKPQPNLLSEGDCTSKSVTESNKYAADAEKSWLYKEKPAKKENHKIKYKTYKCAGGKRGEGYFDLKLWYYKEIKEKEDEKPEDEKVEFDSTNIDVQHISYLIMDSVLGSGTYSNDMLKAFKKIKSKQMLISIDKHINSAHVYMNKKKETDGYMRYNNTLKNWYIVGNIQQAGGKIVTIPTETPYGKDWWEKNNYSYIANNLACIIDDELDIEPDNWSWIIHQSTHEVIIRNKIMKHIVDICGKEIVYDDTAGINWDAIDSSMPSAQGSCTILPFATDNAGNIIGINTNWDKDKTDDLKPIPLLTQDKYVTVTGFEGRVGQRMSVRINTDGVDMTLPDWKYVKFYYKTAEPQNYNNKYFEAQTFLVEGIIGGNTLRIIAGAHGWMYMSNKQSQLFDRDVKAGNAKFVAVKTTKPGKQRGKTTTKTYKQNPRIFSPTTKM